MGDFIIPFSPIDRLSRKKLNREMLEITGIINQIELTDIFRTSPTNTKECTFSAPHETFSKTDHILVQEASLNRYKKSEITPCISIDHHGWNQNINNRKLTNSRKLSL